MASGWPSPANLILPVGSGKTLPDPAVNDRAKVKARSLMKSSGAVEWRWKPAIIRGAGADDGPNERRPLGINP